MKKYNLYIIVLFFIIACNSSLAKAENFQINLIVFSHITQEGLNAENWPNELFVPDFKDTVELQPFSESKSGNMPYVQPYQKLEPDKIGLKKEIHQLEQHADYKIVQHLSWIQAFGPLTQSNWVHIAGGQPYDADGKPITTENLGEEIPTFWEINGKIKITKPRYFDITAKLYLTLPKSMCTKNKNDAFYEKSDLISLRSFKLDQHHRVTLNNLIYLDHPLFGMLIKITPV